MPLALWLACSSAACEVGADAAFDDTSGAGGKSDSATRSAIWAIYAWNYDLQTTDRHDKYCNMARSPFAFYRGTNHLFWQDLAGDPRLQQFGSADSKTWLQGDLHAYNFGSYENASAEVVYGLNDFDESLVEDYQYDLWRMAASMILLAKGNGDLSRSQQGDFVDSFAESYLDSMSDYRDNSKEWDRTFDKDESYGPLADFIDDVHDDNSRGAALEDWTHLVSGERRLDTTNAKLSPASPNERIGLLTGLATYHATLDQDIDASYLQVKDIARRLLAGTGSLGTPRYYVLIEGPSVSQDDDRILDVKQQHRPTPYWFLDTPSRAAHSANFPNPAERHATAMRAMVHDTDPLLGWLRWGTDDYSVRERSIYKDAFPADQLSQRSDYQSMAEQWGIVLASAHARADQDFDASYVGASLDHEIHELTNGQHSAFRAALREFAFSYAQQVQDDYDVFLSNMAPPDCP